MAFSFGEQNGGSGTGAGAGTGNGGLAGRGSGSASSGNGNGGNQNAACADVELDPSGLGHGPNGSVLQSVVANVTLTDGTTMTGEFPYPFVYPSDRKNPFAHDDQLAPNGGIPVQLPPPGTDLADAPPAVQFVIAHTDADGYTTLRSCSGNATPGAAPSAP